jgi:conjugative transfer signal peptidase TraF
VIVSAGSDLPAAPHPSPAAPRRRRTLARGGLLLVLAPVFFAALHDPRALSFRLNTSPSLPLGLYRLERARPLARGAFVLACPPLFAASLALARGYLPPGSCPGGVQPLGKLLLALPGDVVSLTPAQILVNGRPLPSSRSVAIDSAGRPLAHFPFGSYRVGRDDLWLFSPHPRSFDCRYFGPVPRLHLRGTLTPLWIARDRFASPVGAIRTPLRTALADTGPRSARPAHRQAPAAPVRVLRTPLRKIRTANLRHGSARACSGTRGAPAPLREKRRRRGAQAGRSLGTHGTSANARWSCTKRASCSTPVVISCGET